MFTQKDFNEAGEYAIRELIEQNLQEEREFIDQLNRTLRSYDKEQVEKREK